MFGLFRNRRREREFAAGVHIQASFELLRSEAPGAAYLFARTPANTRSLVDNPTMSRQEKIAAIQAEIDATDDKARNAGAGIPELALQFVQRLLDVEKRDVVAAFGHSVAFGNIAKLGDQYRALEPRDRRPPADEGSRAVLAKQHLSCVGEVVDGILAQCKEMGGDQGEANADIATVLAAFDLREEASSGRLQLPLRALAAAIKR